MAIHLADGDWHKRRANVLLNRMYSSRGYRGGHQVPAGPHSMTFTATCQDDVVGTLTLTIDSGLGLAADRTFNDRIERFRMAPGARLCELTKFAFDTSTPARPRLAALFHLIFIYGTMHYDCTDLLIEVNPRHRRFYQVMLGFAAVGEERINAAVNAPSQLMWLHVADIRSEIDKHAGQASDCGRSLYPYFFSDCEEQRISDRLTALSSSRLQRLARSAIFKAAAKREREASRDQFVQPSQFEAPAAAAEW